MGKPYAEELRVLAETFTWAACADVAELASTLAATASYPLLAVGSGGSLTAAHLAVDLHQRHSGKLAKAVTPLELLASDTVLGDAAVLLVSAGGKNPDVLSAFEYAVAREPRRFAVVCSASRSPLAENAGHYRYVAMHAYDLPIGKDGFLATNSLLAFTILLQRAYGQAFANPWSLPPNLADVLHPGQSETAFVDNLRDRCRPLWGLPNLAILYGPAARVAAVDLESKFTEAALAATQPADYRNFAHGRHHWLAKHGAVTGVLALVTEEDRPLADATLALLPAHIPLARIDIPGSGPEVALTALVSALYVAGLAGEARGIDPGRPGVPPFGRRLYNLRAPKARTSRSKARAVAVEVTMTRKIRASRELAINEARLAYWRAAHSAFVEQLAAAEFGAVVFDYDGTLCDQRDRYTGLGADVIGEIIRLLEHGVIIGVVTGRGRSVKEVLRTALPVTLWPRVVLGYYNGSDLGALSDDTHPDRADSTGSELQTLAAILADDARLADRAAVTYRQRQITIEPHTPLLVAIVWELTQHLVRAHAMTGVALVQSSHSIDVLAPGVTKRALVDHVRTMLNEPALQVLCVGDRGRWPGNDFALLAEPYALSVDEVSPDPGTGWNIASPGCRGVQATLEYLRCLTKIRSGIVRFVAP